MLSAESSTRARTPSGRISYARIDRKVDGISYERFEIPNLIELQLDSFAWFVDKGLRAGLDVFEREPAAAEGVFEDSIVDLPGVYGTHHIGASTDQAHLTSPAAAAASSVSWKGRTWRSASTCCASTANPKPWSWPWRRTTWTSTGPRWKR